MGEKLPADLVRGSLDMLILAVLAEEPKYGYLIQKRIRHATNDGVPLAAGTLYPLLHRLESEGLIRSRWEDAGGRQRKWYEISAAGRRQLSHQAYDWQRFSESIEQLLAVVTPKPRPA